MTRTPCQIVPPFLLEHLAAAHPHSGVVAGSAQTLQIDARLRERRSLATAPVAVDGPFAVHTAVNGSTLPGELVRSAGQPASGDVAVDEAYAGVEASLALFS